MKKKMIMRFAAVMMLMAVIMSCSWAVCAAPEESSDSQTTTAVNTKEKKNPVKIILISLGVGLAISGVSVFLIAHGYKNNGKSEPYPYNKKAPLDLSVRTDTHIDTKLEKKKIEKNENN